MKRFGNRQLTLQSLVTGLVGMALVSMALAAEPPKVSSLDESPLVHRLWLGMEEGVIRPASYEQLLSSVEQRVGIYAAHGAKIKKGQNWATLDPLNLEFERRAHAIDLIRGQRDLVKEMAALEEERVETLVAQQEAIANLLALQQASKDSSLPEQLRRRSEVAATKLEQKIDLLNDELEPEMVEQKRELLRKEAALKQERRDKQLEDVEKRSLIIASCDGSLVLSAAVLEALEDVGESNVIWVKGNEVIGVVRNDDHYQLWVDAQGPLLSDLPLERITVRIQDARTGAMIPASHERTEEMENGAEIKRTYVFRIGEKDAEKASKSMGVRCMVHIYVTFEKPYRMVYKKDIAHLNPARLESSGWAGLVQLLWPGSKVIHVGPQTIAVQPADEN